jgi:L,D-peptidoglycan transpeptidase YkuD (ErfK/YbiS/YcfS/YnhG family)
MTEKLDPFSRVFIGAVSLFLLLAGCVLPQHVSYQLVRPTKELSECDQMILVKVPSWNAVSGVIQLFERNQAGKWIVVRSSFPCVVGKNGLAWGIGLHGTGVLGEPRKQEGDGRAPAGVFRLNTCMGIASRRDARILCFPYRQIIATTEGVDDTRSRYYNRVVDRNKTNRPDWSSAEKMFRSDGLYQWIVVVEHNWKPNPGFGSCIFLHLWQGEGVPTVGCTAMDLNNLTFLIRWLDAEKHPLLVQLPQPIYRDLKPSWRLP